jgi:16S rRNA processing protein RimM
LSNRHIPVGKVVGTHGIAGWLKLKSFNPNSTALLSTREISLAHGTHSESYTLDQAKPHKRIVLLKLKGVDRIEAAEQLVGHELSVPEDALRPLGDDEYYYLDVIGFDVYDTKTNYLGKVTRVWLKEGGDLYVVGGTKKQHLIPATKEIVEEVDLSNQRIIVDLPDGLLDL